MSQDVLPVPPHIVARVIQVAADPDSSAIELAKIIKMDAVMSTQILKSVNSAYYGLRRKIASVERAVSFMGIRAVRNLVLCLGVRELAPNKSEYPLELFWECSLRRASAAKYLARKCRIAEEEELFTLGLCQDLGVMLLIRQSTPEAITAFSEAVHQNAATRREIEQKFGQPHDELGAMLFEKWEFPEDIIVPERWHHEPQIAPPEYRLRAQIANLAENIADLTEIEDKTEVLETTGALLGEIGVDPEELSEIIDEVSRLVTEAAEMLAIKVGPQPSYQEIAQQASQGLLSLNMSYQSLTEQLQDSLDQQQQMAERLQQLNKELERRALTDELTGLPNRRAFDEGLEKELERVRRIEKPLSLVMFDVDHFKQFNDNHGHQAGDLVLKEVGRTLKKNARACDLPARYGGEEFAVILPHTPIDGAVIAAERIRLAIEQTLVRFEGKDLKITASFGVAAVKDATASRAGVLLLRRADDALYEAKEAGRNCVRKTD